MKLSDEETEYHARARSLLHDIEHASAASFPRRETIVEWLNRYLSRASQKGYLTEEAEAKDLIALADFLRENAVPVTTPSAA